MKKNFLLLVFSFFTFVSYGQIQNAIGVGAGFGTGGLNASAIMEARSTTKGFLVPRMTTTQRNTISSPATSLLIFNTTTGAYNYYNGSSWSDFGGSQDLPSVLTNNPTATSGSNIVNLDYVNGQYELTAGGDEQLIVEANTAALLGSLSGNATQMGVINGLFNVVQSSGGGNSTTLGITTPISASIIKEPAPTVSGTYTKAVTASVNGGTKVPVDSSGNVDLTVSTGSGTVAIVSVVTANGVTGSVANATTTPAITLSLGAITPTTVVASGNVTAPNIDATNKTDIATNATNIALKSNIASPTFTGTVTVPNGAVLGTPASINLANATFPTLNQNTSGTAANLSGTPALPNGTTATTQTANDNSTKLATTAYVYTKKDKSMDALVLSGKTIVAFGDSYTTSVGATNTGRGYISYLANGLGCNLSNNAVQGTTIMKRTPINYINSPNMVDNMTNIPTYSESTHAFLMFEFGLNDMGQNGANYTAANLITDYQTILTYANGTKGWPFNKILILGAPYANSTGYAAYAALSGNSAPTTQHHLDIIEAERQVAQTNQTMFIDLYAAQVKNGVSTTMSADGYHPNDPGHYGLAKIIANSLGLGATFISRVPVSSSTPAILVNGGASYSVTLGEQANINTIVYNDGVNKAGFGPSTNTLEYHIYSGGKHNFYVNNVLLESIKTTGPETTLTTTTGGLKVGYVAKTANYTVGTNDHTINCTANSFTVTLLSAVTVGAGKIYTINNSGSGTITTATTSSQTIDGTTPPSLTQNHNITVESDGANWIILSQK